MSELPEARDPNTPSPRSVIEQIRAAKAKSDPKLRLPIPAWNGSLYVDYRRLTPKQIQQATSSSKPAVANARVLALACVEVLAVDPESGELVPVSQLIEDGSQAPVRFDGRLSDAFGVSGDSPWAILRAFFEDDVAVSFQAQRLLEWQKGEDLDRASDDEIEAFAGED